ncbi:L-selectin-like [Scomber scombrus]|uniref:L-selectin-like n=1 Tax=Scomber scombrus TaxID=13677 RepID=A0AAV1PU23_SCOSC
MAGWFIFSTSGLHQYHYVDKDMTWTDAQTYCKEKYTDLATIENEEDQNQLNNMVSSVNNHVWIGLYSNIVWKWSDGYRGRGPESMNWQTLPDNKPDFSSSHQSCVDIDNSGRWWADACSRERPFICYNGTQLDPQFVYISDINELVQRSEVLQGELHRPGYCEERH